MKKIVFMSFMLVQIYSVTSAQTANIPNGVTTPLTATATLVPEVTLPSIYIPSGGSGVYNLNRTYVPMKAITSTTDPSFTYSPSSSYYTTKAATTYLNGWGTPIQTIVRGSIATPATQDVLTPIDIHPCHTKNNFLPYLLPTDSYFQTSPYSAQQSYYSTAYPNEDGMTYAQSVTSYPSAVPTTLSCSPGSSFVGNGNGTTVTTTINTGTENIFEYPGTSGTAFYPAGSLLVKTTTGPHSAKTIEYFDKDNREVCKQVALSTTYFASTYYVYNDLGKLTSIITPRGSGSLAEPTYDVSQLTYSYSYNSYGSPVSTALPDKSSPDYVVYDLKNRPVLCQTALMHSLGKYKFNIYDNRDRVIITGILSDATNSYATWQSWLYEITSPFISAGGAAATIPPGSLLGAFLYGVSYYPTSIPTLTNCVIEQVNFYDSYPVSRTFNTSYSGYYGEGAPYYDIPTPYMVTQGLPTFSMSRVLDGGMATTSDLWTCSAYFYDQKGRTIQVQTVNPANAQHAATCLSGAPSASWDVLTTKYSFTGQKAIDVLFYNNPASDKPTTTIVNSYSYDFDNGCRLMSTHQAIDGGPAILIASYTYDDFGKATQKSMGGIEIQNYDYNIRNQLTGINRNYIGDPCAATTATFGCILNYDYGFSTPRYDGKISGFQWLGAAKTSVPLRAYGYTYDPAGRLIQADFRQYCLPGTNTVSCFLSLCCPTWNNEMTDYTASNIHYDANGNLTSMNQMGVIPASGGGTTTGLIDQLTYSYQYGSNRLNAVVDAVTANYGLGDFVGVDLMCSGDPVGSAPPRGGHGGSDGGGSSDADSYGSYGGSGSYSGGTYSGGTYSGGGATPSSPEIPCQDYSYDADGNLASDSNKHINSIVYNEMDEPLSVTFDGGNTITNTYTGDGTLITKNIATYATAAGTTTETQNIYQYWGPFIYLGNGSAPSVLQYALNDQGRVRYNPTTNLFTYDYFVKDHLGNVRTVVTGNVTNSTEVVEEATTLTEEYLATHEVAAASVEDAIFTNIDRVRADKPESTDPSDTKAAGLNGNDTATMIGTSILLQVMAGDQFSLSAQTYWSDDSTYTTDSSSTILNALISTMTNAQANANLGENGTGQIISSTFTPANYALYQGVVDSIANPSIPQAFLNYMVFDQYMNLIPSQSGTIQVGATADGWQAIGTTEPITVSQSGYVAIYISDASTASGLSGGTGSSGGTAALPCESCVYIDRITIGVSLGTLIQEQHYYPFGLSIKEGENATITPNRYEYQSKLLMDAGYVNNLNYSLYDFTARQYDEQLGRFWGVDPASQFPSGYTGMGNDPSNMTDPSGCWSNVVTAAPLDMPRTPGGGGGGVTNCGTNSGVTVDGVGASVSDVILAVLTNDQVGGAGTGTTAGQNSGPNSNGNNDQSSMVSQVGGASSSNSNATVPGVTSDNPTNETAAELPSSSSSASATSPTPDPDPQSGSTSPTMGKGGVINNNKDFYSFMVDAANNAVNHNGDRCEVAAWAVIDPKSGQTVYVVQPWNNNKFGESDNFAGNLVPYGYTSADINGEFHTHPGSTPPSSQDWMLSKEWGGLPVHTIGADGQVYMIMYPSISRNPPMNVTYIFK